MKINFNLRHFKENLLNPAKPTWIVVTILILAIVFTILQKRTHFENDQPPKEIASLDTFIPAGFVLVTLQLVNAESIESMVGAYCLVDLYPASPSSELAPRSGSVAIANHLRLIRAPNNPSLFGVLVPEDSQPVIQQLAGPVFAVIQGPKASGSIPKVNSPKPRGRTINYGDLL